MTTTQLQTLKADIAASADLNTIPIGEDGSTAIAALYNLPAAVDFWVWRATVAKAEFVNGLGPDGTVFNWTGTGFITRTVGERDAWRELFSSNGTVNPSLTNVRQAFNDIFSGATAPAPANRLHLLAVARRKASRIEKLLATGTGTTAAPGLMGFEGPVTAFDIEQARTN
jgi:hypothetical protein